MVRFADCVGLPVVFLLRLLFWSLLWGPAVVFCAPAAGAPQEQVPPPFAHTATLKQVVFVDPLHGWAAGELGTLWRTTNGGQRWQLARLPEPKPVTALCFLDARRGWAATAEALPGAEFTRGKLWYTADGGRSWQLRSSSLPGLLQVRFFDPRQGMAACVPSPLAPTGVLRTGDGGRSWSPVPGQVGGTWQAALFLSPQQGVLAGEDGRLAVLAAGGVRAADTPGFGLRRVRTFAADGQGTLWLAGSAGLLAQSTDGGRSWQLVPLGKLAPVAAQVDFYALAVRGSRLWVAGSPGTVVFHSPDAGRSWQLWPTGASVPIHHLHFVDSRRGWAAGALGTVLATVDGGRSWHVQRSGGTRAAVWGVWINHQAFPWEALAWLAAEKGYLTAVTLLGRREAWGRPWDHQYRLRCGQALARLGVACTEVPWGFPLPQPDLAPNDKALERLWAAVHDGRHQQVLEQYLLRQILQWRPEVVLTHAAVPQHAQPGAVLLNQMVQQAVQRAADPTTWPPELVQLKFKPWQVKKLWGVLPPGRRGQVQVGAFQFAQQFGCSLRQLVGPRRVILPEQGPVPESWQFRLIDSQLPQQAAAAGLMSQVVLYRGGEARRLLHQNTPPEPQQLLAAQRYRNAWALLRGGQVAPQRVLAGLDSLLQGVPPEHRAQLVFEFAQGCCEQGDWATAAQALEHLVHSWPQSPLAPAAARWLACYWAGAEPAWADGTPPRLPSSTLAQVAPPEEMPDGASPLAGKRLVRSQQARLEQATRWLGWLNRHAPQVARGGAMPLVAASLARRRGDRQAALRHLLDVTQRPGQNPWAAAAARRRWVLLGQGLRPKLTVTCPVVKQKPYLDGKLDEPLWQQTGQVVLSHPRLPPGKPAAVIRLARDEEFLYIAGTCRRWQAAGAATEEAFPGPGPRDAPVEGQDRVEWFLDLDGDHATWFRFVVDHRGHAREECWGAAAWNPQWFVAVQRQPESWSFEAAVPLAVLVSRPPGQGEAWSLGLKRVVPGVGLFSWGRPQGTFPRPEGWGLLLFTR